MHDDDQDGPRGEPSPTFERPTMLNGCARAATRDEARFRVDYPNSAARASRVIALDPAAAGMTGRIAEAPWLGARFLRLAPSQPDISPNDVDLIGPEGEARVCSQELAGADLIVMLATSSDALREAEIIGRLARQASVMVAGVVVAGPEGDAVAGAMRPVASVLVVAADEDYLAAMLAALRA